MVRRKHQEAWKTLSSKEPCFKGSHVVYERPPTTKESRHRCTPTLTGRAIVEKKYLDYVKRRAQHGVGGTCIASTSQKRTQCWSKEAVAKLKKQCTGSLESKSNEIRASFKSVQVKRSRSVTRFLRVHIKLVPWMLRRVQHLSFPSQYDRIRIA